MEKAAAWVEAPLQDAALHCPGAPPALWQAANQVLGPFVAGIEAGRREEASRPRTGAAVTAAQERQPNAAAAADLDAQLPSAAAWCQQVELGLLPRLEQAARAHASRPVSTCCSVQSSRKCCSGSGRTGRRGGRGRWHHGFAPWRLRSYGPTWPVPTWCAPARRSAGATGAGLE